MIDDRFRRMAVGMVVGVLVVTPVTPLVGARAQQAPVGDQWADNCDEARTLSESRTYEGAIDTPEDVDVLGLELPEKGSYATVQLVVPTTEGVFVVDVAGSISIANVRLEDGVYHNQPPSFAELEDAVSSFRALDRRGTDNSSFGVFAEQSGRACLAFYDDRPDAATFPYQWQATLTFNEPGETNPPGQILSAEEAAQYRRDLRTLSERVSELEATVEALEQRVADLEDELANETATGNDDSGT